MVHPLPSDSAALLPRRFRVTRSTHELPDVRTLALRPADGGEPIRFAPGQFTMAYAFGIGEVPLSISGTATPDALALTVRDVGPVTRAICAARKGDVLGVRGPFGTAWPLETAVGRDVVLMAGGLGLAPLRPLVRAIAARRDAFRRVVVLVGTRTPDALLYAREMSRWRNGADLDVRVTVDAADAAWHGEVGAITTLLPRVTFDPARASAFVCGPEVMMRVSAAALADRGVPASSIYLSMERNMKCAVGVCGHCMFGPAFVCKDGPVFPYSRVEALLRIREV